MKLTTKFLKEMIQQEMQYGGDQFEPKYEYYLKEESSGITIQITESMHNKLLNLGAIGNDPLPSNDEYDPTATVVKMVTI